MKAHWHCLGSHSAHRTARGGVFAQSGEALRRIWVSMLWYPFSREMIAEDKKELQRQHTCRSWYFCLSPEWWDAQDGGMLRIWASERAQLILGQLQIKPVGMGSFRYALRVGFAATFHIYHLSWTAGTEARVLDVLPWCQQPYKQAGVSCGTARSLLPVSMSLHQGCQHSPSSS